MAELHTPRHALPELAVAQSQKEVTHNEAIRRIDSLLHPLIQGVLSSPPSDLAAADAGKCWLVGTASTGIWAGKANNIATDGCQLAIPSACGGNGNLGYFVSVQTDIPRR
ncbi:MAG: DUF2793 domain-containing protein [Sphingomonadales bacterium]|nr:DUF2793 domain-containing protein [Sphingomonadales bacterium]